MSWGGEKGVEGAEVGERKEEKREEGVGWEGVYQNSIW